MEEITMSMLQMDVARELHRDRERMVAEAFRAGGSTPAPRRTVALTTPRLVTRLLAALDHVAVLTGERLHFAH
jgi:hypothetical protein